jgi:hypothetical protein
MQNKKVVTIPTLDPTPNPGKDNFVYARFPPYNTIENINILSAMFVISILFELCIFEWNINDVTVSPAKKDAYI